MFYLRLFLLCFCFIGAVHAKAEHTSDLRLTPPLVSSTSVVNHIISKNDTELSTLSVLNKCASNNVLSCSSNSTSKYTSPIPKLTSSIDLSHDIYINGFTLRFAHINVSDDELTPEYVKIFEFPILPHLETTQYFTEVLSPQLNWMMQTNTQASRLSSWKDSNLQYIPQQYPSSLA
ncbi:hypothetical protein HC725_04020 [Vibrio sp. S17_S38]|uniref:hypothetical protein n=1 Tax=Vibrio sp. S17_S38 TaxID=2720229 RepID=UPI00168059D6|nr:hypothetical protein [Vibrio sp. S17_S38]MBD1572453.1 hypothetical protein [Vibrio sp. S17_S38]